jgi:hypothetical protein
MLVVVLAGGYLAEESGILRAMTAVRRAMALDLLERVAGAAAEVRVVLLSDCEELLQAARSLGCAGERTRVPFVWLEAVQQAIRERARTGEAVLVLGGSSAPFLKREQVRELAGLAETGVVWQNNRLSPDLVLFAPASAALSDLACRTDNDFGYALERDAGLERKLLPRELAYSYDVDTPLDALLAARMEGAGSRLAAAVQEVAHRVPLEEALAVLRRGDYPDVVVIGRAHPEEAEHFARRVGVRLRLYSEERGMKALGRIERGELRSLVGLLLDAVEPELFFERMSEQASCLLWDTRVLFAHRRLELTERERFAADLGRWEEISDPWLRRFVQAAQRATVPVLMGGQTLVSGGLRVLADLVQSEGAGQQK